MYVCVRVCVCVCVCVCVHARMHMHAHTHTRMCVYDICMSIISIIIEQDYIELVPNV